MAKHLTKQDVEAVIDIIYGHDSHKLTWEELCEASAQVIGKKPTRQSLYSHEAIREAYKTKKANLKLKTPVKPRPSNLNIAAERIARLEGEVETLKSKNTALLEQFVVWQYNAYKYGLKEHQLNEPLPRIDRERTTF